MKNKNVLCIVSMTLASACASDGSDLETNSISQGAGPCLTCGVGGEWQYMLRTQNRPNAHNSGELAPAYFLENDDTAKKYIAVRSLRPSSDGSDYGDREAHCSSSSPPYGVWGLDNTSKIRVAKCTDAPGTYQVDSFIYGKKIYLPDNENTGYFKIEGLATSSDSIQTHYIVRAYNSSGTEQRPYCTNASSSATTATAIAGIQPLVFLPIYLFSTQYRFLNSAIHSEADFSTVDVLGTRMSKAARHDVISLVCPQDPALAVDANRLVATLFKNGNLFADFVLGGSSAASYTQLRTTDGHLSLGNFLGVNAEGLGTVDSQLSMTVPFSKTTLQSVTSSTNVEALWSFDSANINNGARCVNQNTRLNIPSASLGLQQVYAYESYDHTIKQAACPPNPTNLLGTKYLQLYTETLAVNTPSWMCVQSSCYQGSTTTIDNSTNPATTIRNDNNYYAYYYTNNNNYYSSYAAYYDSHPVVRRFKLIPYYKTQAQWDAITDTAQAQDVIADASWRETLAHILRLQTGILIKEWKKYLTSSREEFYDRVRKEAYVVVNAYPTQCRAPFYDNSGSYWYLNNGSCGYVAQIDINGTNGDDSGWEITGVTTSDNTIKTYSDLRQKVQEITGKDYSVVSYDELRAAVEANILFNGPGSLDTNWHMEQNFYWAGGLPNFTDFKNANFIPASPFSASTLVTTLP